MTNNIPIFAHRGASGHALENTFKAFKKARDLGADGIELDIQCTKDGVFVVYHDFDLFRLTGIKKTIVECTFEELLQFRLGKPLIRCLSVQRIPSFKQIVDWSNQHDIPLNIELKESILTNISKLVDVLQHLSLPKGSHFSSFHEELIKIVKMQRPDFETALIVTRKFDWNELKDTSHFNAIHAHKKYYKQKYLQRCRETKKGIRFYGINGSESFIKTPHPQVIGWITDYPKRVAKRGRIIGD